MSATGFLAATAGSGRLLIGGLLLVATLAPGARAVAAEPVNLSATYVITIGGITIGRAEAKARFTGTGYAAAINGSTYGVSRIVSDARAVLAGSGRISEASVAPASYNLETSEAGFETRIRMGMSGGAITSLQAVPELMPAPDRVPVTPSSRRNIVDPVGAFMVAAGQPGQMNGPRACNRTVRVFDGWQRFDIRLAFKEMKPVTGGANSYAGELIVCSARYVPVAGHRPGRANVQYMTENKRLEVWLAPIAGTNLFVPYHILIGTQIGDLVIRARSFVVTGGERQATSIN